MHIGTRYEVAYYPNYDARRIATGTARTAVMVATLSDVYGPDQAGHYTYAFRGKRGARRVLAAYEIVRATEAASA
jgi:hypothetical protein